MNLQIWNSIVNPQLQLLDKKWGHLQPFWSVAGHVFPEDMDKLCKLEQTAWNSFKKGESSMILRIKVSSYFDLLHKICEKASKDESWRSPRSVSEPNGSPPF